MKKTVIALVLGMLVAGSTMAQQAPQKDRRHRTEQQDGKDRKIRLNPEERAARRTEKMSKELGLNKSQTKKLQALNLKQAQQQEAMHAQYQKGDKRSKSQRAEMKAARENWNAALKDILTKKQYAQYQEKREEMRAQHKERRGHDGERSNRNRQQQSR